MVFNEILIPQDSFSMTTVTRPRIRRRRFMTIFPKLLYLKTSHLITCFFMLENMRMNSIFEQNINKIKKIKRQNNSYPRYKQNNDSYLYRIFFLLFSADLTNKTR